MYASTPQGGRYSSGERSCYTELSSGWMSNCVCFLFSRICWAPRWRSGKAETSFPCPSASALRSYSRSSFSARWANVADSPLVYSDAGRGGGIGSGGAGGGSLLGVVCMSAGMICRNSSSLDIALLRPSALPLQWLEMVFELKERAPLSFCICGYGQSLLGVLSGIGRVVCTEANVEEDHR